MTGSPPLFLSSTIVPFGEVEQDGAVFVKKSWVAKRCRESPLWWAERIRLGKITSLKSIPLSDFSRDLRWLRVTAHHERLPRKNRILPTLSWVKIRTGIRAKMAYFFPNFCYTPQMLLIWPVLVECFELAPPFRFQWTPFRREMTGSSEIFPLC